MNDEKARELLGVPFVEWDGSKWIDYDKALELARRVVELERELEQLRQVADDTKD